jgi:hypothetical protein
MGKKFARRILLSLLGLLVLCIFLVGAFALSNRGLPTRSQVLDHLSDVEKARLAEAIHLRETIGGAAWPGWEQAEIPIIVYNEAFAFLIGLPDPPDGWLRMPQREARGGPWEIVPGDTLGGQVYYRQPLPDPEKTPENFTVLVGEQWAATLQTKEYAEIVFYQGFRDELPPILVEFFPYRLAWKALMGETDTYIGAMEHEAFHAFQGSTAPERLRAAEEAVRWEEQYPWDNRAMEKAWKSEMNLLVQAAQAESEDQARRRTAEFLAERDARRAEFNLSTELVGYERQREWLEGLAKYIELMIGRLAGAAPGYQPLPGLEIDPNFKAYATRQRFWSQQLGEARRTQGRSGETRFYYSGNAQAVVLDRLVPGWKQRALSEGIFLEDLLRQAIP